MEEVKCCLLGFHSGMLEQALESSSAAIATTPAAGDDAAAALSAQMQALCESRPFHPTERALLERVLPLGRSYAALQRAAREVAMGRAEGLYPAALGSGITKVLAHYVEAVKVAATPSALAALAATYATAFSLLGQLVAAQESTEAFLPLLDRFLHHHEVPVLFRSLVGESVWLALLYTTAHYVAHGVVLHARPDYFIALDTRPSAGRAAGAEEHTLYVDRLPRGVPADLGLLILAAGKERRVLLRDAEVQGGRDYLEQLALGSQDEAANAVFHSIFNAQLCQGGALATEELTARVEAAATLWSRALWMKVGDVPVLRDHLAALRSVFLCHRGDIWYAFVERVLPAFARATPLQLRGRAAGGSSLPVSAPLQHEEEADEEEEGEGEGDEEGGTGAPSRAARAAAARCAFLQRTAADAFAFALSVSNVRDRAAYEPFSMRVSSSGVEAADEVLRGRGASKAAASAPLVDGGDRSGTEASTSRRTRGARTASTEDMAKHLLQLVQSMQVQYSPPQGLPLIVSGKSMQYYQRLLTFHLALRFSLQALAVTRALFSEALLTNAKPSADLRRAFTLFHLLQFLASTVVYYMQVDVISACTAKLEEQFTSTACASVEQAKRLHDQFIWSVAEASFLTEGSEALLRACQALNTCAVTLYTMCTRYRIPYWAVEGVNDTPLEVRATLSALEMRVQQDVVAVFTGHLGLGSRPWERALWGRLDFNKFFSQHRARSVLPTPIRSGSAAGAATAAAVAAAAGAAATGFAQPQSRRTRSSGVAANRSGKSDGATTPRRLRSSSKRAGGA